MKKSYQKHSAFCILHSAFTLIELLVVMVVITMLVGITIPVSKYIARRAREANQRIYVEKIKSALEDYRAAYGEYPITSAGNLDDVKRHYPTQYLTKCYYTTSSPYASVNLTTNTVETMATAGGTIKVDYGLTYPLMLKQLESGARPFMDFKEVTVAYLVSDAAKVGDDTQTYERRRKKKGGGVAITTTKGVYGNPVNRSKAIDPVSMQQWKYSSYDGVTYSLATNSF